MSDLTFFQQANLSSPLARRELICRFEWQMRQEAGAGRFEVKDFPLIHTFSEGKYLRSIFLPAGTSVVGKLHRHECFNWITSGLVQMFTETGGLELLRGPCKMLSPAGTKRVLHVLEDTIWTVEHLTSSTDLSQIESEVIAESYSALGLDDPMIRLLEMEGA